ncbi:MAG: potassium channel family protein [Kosmotogales bacterium]|nr:potassium channel family protein [Kosmotogales bacterium]
MDKKKNALSLNRLEAITDGIFAIVMTLLILNLEIPPTGILTSNDLLNGILNILPQIINYAVTFLLLSIFWIIHIHQIRMIKHTDKVHLILNFFFLFFITLFPFTTSLMGDFPDLYASEALFHLNVFAAYLFACLQWRYATKRAHFLKEEFSKEEIATESLKNKILLFVPLIITVLGFFLPIISSLLFVSIPFILLFINITRKKKNV